MIICFHRSPDLRTILTLCSLLALCVLDFWCHYASVFPVNDQNYNNPQVFKNNLRFLEPAPSLNYTSLQQSSTTEPHQNKKITPISNATSDSIKGDIQRRILISSRIHSMSGKKRYTSGFRVGIADVKLLENDVNDLWISEILNINRDDLQNLSEGLLPLFNASAEIHYLDDILFPVSTSAVYQSLLDFCKLHSEISSTTSHSFNTSDVIYKYTEMKEDVDKFYSSLSFKDLSNMTQSVIDLPTVITNLNKSALENLKGRVSMFKQAVNDATKTDINALLNNMNDGKESLDQKLLAEFEIVAASVADVSKSFAIIEELPAQMEENANNLTEKIMPNSAATSEIIGQSANSLQNGFKMDGVNFKIHANKVSASRASRQNEPRFIETQYLDWKDCDIPNDHESVCKLVEIVKKDKSPILVHCAAGIGSTMAYIGMHTATEVVIQDTEIQVGTLSMIQMATQLQWLILVIIYKLLKMYKLNTDKYSTQFKFFKKSIAAFERVSKGEPQRKEKNEGDRRAAGKE